MHCFICVTYMIILTSANPITTREIATRQEKRSLFRDVIESLRIHSQLPEEINQNDDNNLSHEDRYEEALQLPSDVDFIPRRNDRVEMPPLRYRLPKSLQLNGTEQKSAERPKEEVTVYINTHETKSTTTQKPKKHPQTNANKNKPSKNKDSEEDSQTEDYKPVTNNMTGQSQIGNRESQVVVKPTVIVNIRGNVSHKESDIKLERTSNNDTLDIPRNVFNIKQEINMENEPVKKVPNKIKQDIKVVSTHERAKVDEDMMMCETTSFKTKRNEEANRKFDSVLQILFSI